MIRNVRLEGTAVVVEMENGEKVREHSATAVLLADIWTKMASLSGTVPTANEKLIRKIDKRIVAARVKR